MLLLLPALSFAAPRVAVAPRVPVEAVEGDVARDPAGDDAGDDASAGAPVDAPAEVVIDLALDDGGPVDALDPLVAAHPALVRALRTRAIDADLLADVAAVLAAADPRLVALLVPVMPDGALPDLVAEDPRVDLVEADVWLEGTRLVGTARGRGIVENGVWLDVDMEGGPAADLQLGYGRGWSRVAPLDGGLIPPPGPLPVFEGDRVSFSFDLATSGRPGRGPAGAVTARVKTLDARIEDVGPAGMFGPAPDEAVDVLLALVADAPVADADLAVALAVTFGAVRSLVADDLVATVDADAVAWLRYGEGLDAWLAGAKVDWRFSTLDALGKLTWAWPAAQSIVYGAVPLAGQREPLDAARYRFVVPDTATLARLRDRAPLSPSAAGTARGVDRAVNATLRYRAHDALMGELCGRGARPDEECKAWAADRRAGSVLGRLGETDVHLWEGVSATWQVGVFAREHTYVGDCATATALAIGTLQALGIPAIGMGWSGEDFTTPTHDVPLWYDGATFRGTQNGPGPAWARAPVFVYVTLPAVHPVNAWTIGREPGGWSRGGAVAGGWTSYGDLTGVLRDGLAGTVVGGWIDVQAAGGWPSW